MSMIYERPVFIFTAISSVIASCLVGEATAKQITLQTVLSSQDFHSPQQLPTDKVRHRDNYSKSPQSQRVLAQVDNEQVNQTEPLISQRWLGISIAVTSVLFLLLLWVLFMPDERTRAEAAVLNSSSEESALDSEDLYLAADDRELSAFFANEESGNLSLAKTVEVLEQRRMHHDPIPNEELGNLSLAKTVEVLEQRRIHPDPTLNEEPPQTIAKKADLLPINNDGEQKIEIMASRATGIDVVFELIQDLNHGDRRLQRKAIWELGRIGDSRSIEPLVTIMSEVNPLDRNLILSAISQITSRNFEAIHSALFDSLDDSRPEVKIDAIRDITALHKPTSLVTQRLSILLEDPNPEVSRTARWALQKINSGFYSSQGYAAEFAEPKQIVAESPEKSEKSEKYI